MPGKDPGGFFMTIVIGVVWLLMLLVPPLWWVAGRDEARRRTIQTLVVQSVFSLVQAALGLMMLIGKDV